MAAVSGINGAFYIADDGGTPAEFAKVRTWSVDVNAEEVDVTGFGDTGWRTTVGGLKSWTSTVEGQCDNSTGWNVLWSNIGSEVEVRYYISEGGTIYFAGSATVITISPTTSVDSSGTFSATLSGIGALTYTTS
ncbi:MAG: hypothetical protein WC565_09315 [Parcubacteria group bacterium]